jgi:hypothetical protein
LDARLADLVTLIGWVAIVRAAITIFAPEQVVARGSKLLDNRGSFLVPALSTSSLVWF